MYFFFGIFFDSFEMFSTVDFIAAFSLGIDVNLTVGDDIDFMEFSDSFVGRKKEFF